MFNVHNNLIKISHNNDNYCHFYPKYDSSFTHFLDLSDGVQVKGSYLWAKFIIIYLKITTNDRGECSTLGFGSDGQLYFCTLTI